MKKIQKTYSQLLEFRRQQRMSQRIQSPVFYEDSSNGYVLTLSDNGIHMVCNVSGQTDIDDFEQNRIQYCDKYDVPDGNLILTNDLGDNSTWIATNNSVSLISPPAGKESFINSLTGTVDTDVVFNSSVFHVSVWTGLSEECPAYNDEATAFGTPLYDPGAQVYSGWMKVAPSITNQNWEAWVYFNNNVPAYRVIDYKFTSFSDMVKKSDFRIFNKTAYIDHSFKDLSINLSLKSSMNDRIETYLDANTELSSPNGVPLQMCGIMLDYNEW